jgi:acyl-CoA synthetase (AMP-forming)/AMP-acid ligase II
MTAPDGAFPVVSAQVLGRTVRIYRDAPPDLRAVFLSARQRGDQPALSYEQEQYSWGETLDRVARVAAVLRDDYGIKRGDRVALAMRNYPEWVFAFAATLCLGAVSVPLNSWWSGTELAFALADCEARVFIGDAERVEAVASQRPGMPALEAVIGVRMPAAGRADALLDDLLAAHPTGVDLDACEIGADDDATIMYTSGTTGQPKGAVATHRNHVSNLMNMTFSGALEAELAAAGGQAAPAPAAGALPPTILITGPLFHIAWMPITYMSARSGMHCVLMYKWDAARALELIERLHVTSAAGVPTVVRELLDAAARSGRDLSSLKSLGSGGAQASSELIGGIARIFRGSVATGTGYGLTETSGPMVYIGSSDLFERPLAVGRPFPTSEVRVVDEDGHDVPDGHTGESWFRGPTVARGYWKRESDAFRADGWFRSGDLVRLDEDGFVYIVDRIKDIIVRAGENVYCPEVEDVLLTHGAVQEAAVFGVPHDRWGEEVCAVVQVRAGHDLGPDELRQHAASQIAAFKVPTRLAVQADPLPRNAAGKLLKRALRDEWADRDARQASPGRVPSDAHRS